MARTDGLYDLMQRRAIDEMIKLASSGNKRKIVKAFDLAERITPDAHKRAVGLVRDKVEAGHPALLMARHVANGLSPYCRGRFIEGAVIGWHFLYMPISRTPNVALMPTPQEREEFRRGIQRLRNTRPFFPVDFWGDAPYVEGCIAGKHYMHITSEGWVEPCIFTHFATDNIHDVSLVDAFNSPFFREIRYRQPFNDNLLLPCMWMDNPKCSREIMQVTGARPTHEGADVMLTDLQDGMNAYSEEAARVMGAAWGCMQADRTGTE